MAARRAVRPAPDDDDDDHGSNVRRMVEQVEEAAGKEEEEVTRRKRPAEDDGGYEVDLDEEPAVDDDATAPVAPTTKSRRSNRYRDQVERADAAERRERDLQENLRMERLRAESLALAMRGGNQQPAADPLDKDLESVQEERDLVFENFNRLTDEEQKAQIVDVKKKLRTLDNRATEIVARKVLGNVPRPQSRGGQLMEMHYSDILAKPNGARLTQAIYDQLLVEPNPEDPLGNVHQDSAQTLHKAAGLARRRLGLGAAERQDSGNMREKLGFTRGGGGQVTREGGRRVVRLSKEERAMARASYPGLPEHEAYVTYGQRLYGDGDPD